MGRQPNLKLSKPIPISGIHAMCEKQAHTSLITKRLKTFGMNFACKHNLSYKMLEFETETLLLVLPEVVSSKLVRKLSPSGDPVVFRQSKGSLQVATPLRPQRDQLEYDELSGLVGSWQCENILALIIAFIITKNSLQMLCLHDCLDCVGERIQIFNYELRTVS